MKRMLIKKYEWKYTYDLYFISYYHYYFVDMFRIICQTIIVYDYILLLHNTVVVNIIRYTFFYYKIFILWIRTSSFKSKRDNYTIYWLYGLVFIIGSHIDFIVNFVYQKQSRIIYDYILFTDVKGFKPLIIFIVFIRKNMRFVNILFWKWIFCLIQFMYVIMKK